MNQIESWKDKFIANHILCMLLLLNGEILVSLLVCLSNCVGWNLRNEMRIGIKEFSKLLKIFSPPTQSEEREESRLPSQVDLEFQGEKPVGYYSKWENVKDLYRASLGEDEAEEVDVGSKEVGIANIKFVKSNNWIKFAEAMNNNAS